MIVGRLVNLCIKTGDTLDTLTLKDFRAISGLFDEDVYKALELKTCVNGRSVYGGPARESVEKQISNIEGSLRSGADFYSSPISFCVPGGDLFVLPSPAGQDTQTIGTYLSKIRWSL